jgi:hypothetical protein
MPVSDLANVLHTKITGAVSETKLCREEEIAENIIELYSLW